MERISLEEIDQAKPWEKAGITENDWWWRLDRLAQDMGCAPADIAHILVEYSL